MGLRFGQGLPAAYRVYGRTAAESHSPTATRRSRLGLDRSSPAPRYGFPRRRASWSSIGEPTSRASGRTGLGARTPRRPMWRAPSTPRRGSFSSRAMPEQAGIADRHGRPVDDGRASEPQRPGAGRRRRSIRAGPRPSSPATAAPPSRRWRPPSSASSKAGTMSAASSRPAVRATPRSRRLRCAACRSACRRSCVTTSPRATSGPMSGQADICMIYPVTDVSGHQPDLGDASSPMRRMRCGHDAQRGARRWRRPSRPSG